MIDCIFKPIHDEGEYVGIWGYNFAKLRQSDGTFFTCTFPELYTWQKWYQTEMQAENAKCYCVIYDGDMEQCNMTWEQVSELVAEMAGMLGGEFQTQQLKIYEQVKFDFAIKKIDKIVGATLIK